jgi:hypothetical protein
MEQSLLSDQQHDITSEKQERIKLGRERLAQVYGSGSNALPRQAVFQASDGSRWVGALQTDGSYALSHRSVSGVISLRVCVDHFIEWVIDHH